MLGIFGYVAFALCPLNGLVVTLVGTLGLFGVI
jgi:hypothetical protein